MAHRWFLRSGAREYGPYSSKQLKKLADEGRIVPESLVRPADAKKWTRASKIKNLFADPASKPVVLEESSTSASGTVADETASAIDEASRGFYSDQSESNFQNAIAGESEGQESDLPIKVDMDEPLAFADRKTPRRSWRGLARPSRIALGGAAMTLLVMALAGYLASSGARTLTTEEVVASSEASVAFIKGGLSTGTGFLIKEGVVATNRHVIEGELAGDIAVHFPSAPVDKRGPYTAEILYVDDDIDFALLAVEAPLPPLRCASDHTFRRGQEVLIIGNPGVSTELVLENAVSHGIMSTKATVEGRQYNQLSTSINSGNSGGPVLNQSGAVIGMVTLKAAQKEGIAFSLPVESIVASLSEANSLSPDEIAAIQSLHRARAVFKHIDRCGRMYKFGMGAYADVMEIAIDGGRSANDGLAIARGGMESKIAVFDAALVDNLQSELAAISTDSQLSDSTRQRFIDLWTNYLELKSYVDNPRGSYNSYRDKYRQLSDDRDRLAESLKLLLGETD
jgi:S1-C subfamily serine protease